MTVDVVELDVLSDDSAERAVASVVEEAGGIDVLVNNAGIGYMAPLEEITAQQVGDMFATNIGGMIRMTQLVLPHMCAAGRGHIVNVTSIAAFGEPAVSRRLRGHQARGRACR